MRLGTVTYVEAGVLRLLFKSLSDCCSFTRCMEVLAALEGYHVKIHEILPAQVQAWHKRRRFDVLQTREHRYRNLPKLSQFNRGALNTSTWLNLKR